MNFTKNMAWILLLVLTACGRRTATNDGAQEFKFMDVATKYVVLANNYSASIQGRQDIRIIPRVDGHLTDIFIKEGSKVHRGQTLFIIDQIAYQAALEAAQANVAVCEATVATAQLTCENKRILFEKKIVSDFDKTSAENALKMAQAQFKQAKAQEASAQNDLSFTVIKSPSDGVVGKLPYRKGDYVSPAIQDGLTVVAENTSMYVYFSMTERQILELLQQYKNTEAALAKMPDVQLQLIDGSVYPQKGRIESISGVIDKSTGAVSLRAVFPNPDGLLISGGAGSVIVPVVKPEAIVIPQEATFEIQNMTYIYKVVDGTAQSTVVVVEKMNNGKEFIVTDGLKVGDVIIAEGAGFVQDGMKVINSTIKK